jgi:hypothetical protein
VLALYLLPITVFLALALKIDVLPLQLKEDDTPAYLINAKHSGKYIDGNIILDSFLMYCAVCLSGIDTKR